MLCLNMFIKLKVYNGSIESFGFDSGGSRIWLWGENKKNVLSINRKLGIKYILDILFNPSVGGSIPYIKSSRGSMFRDSSKHIIKFLKYKVIVLFVSIA